MVVWEGVEEEVEWEVLEVGSGGQKRGGELTGGDLVVSKWPEMF